MNKENIINNNDIPKIIVLRKPINKVMNLEYLKNFSKEKNLDSLIALYSSKKAYIFPKIKFIPRKKIDNTKQVKINNNKPNEQKKELINNNDALDIKEKNITNKEIKKYNYKKKINMNKHHMNKIKENNLILGSLIDNETEGTFDNNSLEKAKANKFKNFIINKINNNENNKNVKNNIFDMGSISHISKNGSSSAKDKNMEEEIKNNNAFEKIVCDFI